MTDQGIIPEGTQVSCHMMRVDPVNGATLQGTAIFDALILGVISDSALLDESDDPCGLAGTTYPAAGAEPFRGLESTQADDYRRVAGGCGLQFRSEVPALSFQETRSASSRGTARRKTAARTEPLLPARRG